jgi:MOSC domain-containing protein YiiM
MSMPRVVSVNVGTPHQIGEIKGRRVISGIGKNPVEGPVAVKRLNLVGDKQADHSVHGGVNKAVYAYPSENYLYWKTQFPRKKLSWGSFGENLTTEGLQENTIRIGDRLLIGSAEFQVTQPRLPCYKLGLKFGTQTILKSFLESRRTGFYLRVLKEGSVQAGDSIKLIPIDQASPTITEDVETNAE